MGFLVLAAALLLSSCRSESARARDEGRAKAKGIAAAQQRVHALQMKELGGGELSSAEQAERDRLKAEADEELNGGNTPEQAPPAEGPEAEGAR